MNPNKQALTSRMISTIVFVLLGNVGLPCWAVIVLVENQDEPIRGILVDENSVSIEVHEHLPNGTVTKHTIPRVTIDEIVRAVNNERLAGLSPDEPEAYRSYAEDLAIKTEDPEAPVAAIRLYLIAAYLKPNELGRSCLLGMAGLARTPAEERSFRAMAFVLDPTNDLSVLKAPKVKAATFTGVTDLEKRSLRTAIQLLRTGKLDDAEKYFRRPPVEAAAAYYSHIVSKEDYNEAHEANGRLTPRLLRKLLTLEIVLSGITTTEVASESTGFTPWSRLVARDDLTPITPQTLTTITEFDPREQLFRNGKWVVVD